MNSSHHVITYVELVRTSNGDHLDREIDKSKNKKQFSIGIGNISNAARSSFRITATMCDEISHNLCSMARNGQKVCWMSGCWAASTCTSASPPRCLRAGDRVHTAYNLDLVTMIGHKLSINSPSSACLSVEEHGNSRYLFPYPDHIFSYPFHILSREEHLAYKIQAILIVCALNFSSCNLNLVSHRFDPIHVNLVLVARRTTDLDAKI